MKLISLSAAIFFASSQVHAQNLQQEEMVVTATRTETPLAQTFAPVSVLTAAEIEQLQVRDVPELISRFTGVDMVQRGGRGANSSVFIRGTNSGHVLVLVDGVRVGSATLGSSALEFIDPAAIERIELVRGPRSSLYGSDAIGGIVQIFTRKADVEGANLAVNLGYGKYNEQQYRVVTGWKDDATQVNLVASHNSTDGFDRTVFTSNGNDDKDAYSADRFALNASHSVAEGWSLDASGQYQKGESDSDNQYCFIDCEPFSRFENVSADMGVKGQLTSIWLTQLRVGYAQDKSQQDDHVPGVAEINYGGNNSFETQRQSASWQNDVRLGDDNLLSLGVDYYNDKVDSNNVRYAVDQRDNVGVFGQYQAKFGANNMIVALRSDDNEQFGHKNTGSLTYGLEVADGWSVMASYGTAFKAPSFNDLYWPFSGNPNLEPESSNNAEVGVKFQQDVTLLALNIFENRVDDLIAWAPAQDGNWYPFNVKDAKIQGLEAEFGQDFSGWIVAVNYTYLDAKDKATGNRLANRADQLFNADLSRAFGPVNLGLVFEARSSRYADEANTRELAGYGLVNFRAAWTINDALTVDAKVNNLLDKSYVAVENYNEEGLGAFGSVTYRF